VDFIAARIGTDRSSTAADDAQIAADLIALAGEIAARRGAALRPIATDDDGAIAGAAGTRAADESLIVLAGRVRAREAEGLAARRSDADAVPGTSDGSKEQEPMAPRLASGDPRRIGNIVVGADAEVIEQLDRVRATIRDMRAELTTLRMNGGSSDRVAEASAKLDELERAIGAFIAAKEKTAAEDAYRQLRAAHDSSVAAVHALL
jgi:hypothetical protein